MSATAKVIKQIDDDLVLRTATPEDADDLADFHEEVFMHEESGTRAWWIAEWGRDLLTKPHPTFDPTRDALIVTDTSSDRIVSSCLYLSQQWQCDGVAFDVGRPEIVGTRTGFRDRGLIRRQFEVMHDWARERGHDFTVVNGIPSYYRQFGYEMAINDTPTRHTSIASLPKWGTDEIRQFKLRAATAEDLPFITQLLTESDKRCLWTPLHKLNELRYLTFGRGERSGPAWRTAILCESADGDAQPRDVGVLMYALTVAIDLGVILRVEMSHPRYWRLATDALLKEFRERAEAEGAQDPDPEREIKSVRVDLQSNHPAFIFDNGALGPDPEATYAWYVRVPDVPRILTKLAPVLNRRIAGSIHAGYSGTLIIGIDDGGIELSFDDGCFTGATQVGRTDRSVRTAWFNQSGFQQILFGRQSVKSIVETEADHWVRNRGYADLLQTLFPQKLSDVSLSLT